MNEYINATLEGCNICQHCNALVSSTKISSPPIDCQDLFEKGNEETGIYTNTQDRNPNLSQSERNPKGLDHNSAVTLIKGGVSKKIVLAF